MVQVVLYCEYAEQAALVELFFPVRAGDRIEGIVHVPCMDDVAQYCVRVTLRGLALSLQQRAALIGWCSWYAYRGTPDSLLRSSIDLNRFETFVMWLAFQEDSVERTWNAVVRDYAYAVAPSDTCAFEWLYGPGAEPGRFRATLPAWVQAIEAFVAFEMAHRRPLTKVSLQHYIEAWEENQDVETLQRA